MREIKLHTYKGESKPLRAWAEELGLSAGLVRNRLRRGWSIGELIEAQARDGDPMLTYDGETMTIEQWFRKLGLDPRVLKKRLSDGSSLKRTLLLARLRHSSHPHARKVAIAGATKTIAEWAKEKGMDKKMLRRRLDSGWLPQFAVAVK